MSPVTAVHVNTKHRKIEFATKDRTDKCKQVSSCEVQGLTNQSPPGCAHITAGVYKLWITHVLYHPVNK